MPQAEITTKVVESLSACGYLTRTSLAKGIGCGPDRIVDAFDEIEAAGMRLMRVRGPGGGAQFIGRRMKRKAA